jgi:medium-chain acyl-[acyl-carrier-protein] hydrolase
MTTTPSFNSWIKFPKPNPLANLRLFCFPYAGGSSVIFRTWSNGLPETVEVCAVELPGRGAQIKTPPFHRLQPLIEALTPVLLPYLDKPFALFGHSMGALVSFELARLLRKQHGLIPIHLFVSGRRAPEMNDTKPPIHDLPEAAFKEELRRFNGTPEAVLENAELMQLLLPIIRADFAVLETYIYTTEPPFDCPITAFCGLQDPEANGEEMEGWRNHTTADFSLHMLPGDHFFIQSAQALLLAKLGQELQKSSL